MRKMKNDENPGGFHHSSLYISVYPFAFFLTCLILRIIMTV